MIEEPGAALGRRIDEWLQGQREPILRFLEALARQESPSRQPETQAPMLALVGDALAELGFRVRRVSGRRAGGQLLARPDGDGPSQLILGHCDTVWPVGTLADMPWRVEHDLVYGPGVFDMKAGLVQMVFAFRALQALGIPPALRPIVFINSDEEIGSPESRRHIVRLARCARRVFVLEPSLGPKGKLKTARKGVGKFTVRITGQAAHAGLDPERGRSAILELSYVIQSLFELNDVERGLTVNVGKIEGGLSANVVAPMSSAVVDVRVPTREDQAHVEQALSDLRPRQPDTRIEVEGAIGRPPMPRTAGNGALFATAQRAARALGFGIEEATAGGGSDANLTSAIAPTLDGLGAVGAGAHARHEHVSLKGMVQRSALLALLLAARETKEGDPWEAG